MAKDKKNKPEARELSEDLPALPEWSENEPIESLRRLFDQFVDKPLRESINWYFAKKRSKKRLGLWVRVVAIVVAGIGLLIPLVGQIFNPDFDDPGDATFYLQPGWTAIALAVAFGLIWMERFLDGTSGWIRYMSAGLLAIETRDEALLAWAKVESGWRGKTPDEAQIRAAFDLIVNLNKRARRIVNEETQQWMAQFQDSLNQLDALLRSRLRQSEEHAEQVRRQREERGGVFVVIDKPGKLKSCRVTLLPLDEAGEALGPRDCVAGRVGFTEVPVGPWRVHAVAEPAAADASDRTGEAEVIVKAGSIEHVKLALS
jgi:hypothetical protein